MKGHFSCRSITDFSPSAVQSATIQPQSRVLKGKPPCKEIGSAQHLPLACSVLLRMEGLPPHSHPLCPNPCAIHAFFRDQLQPSYLVHMAVILPVVRWVLWDLQKTRNKGGQAGGAWLQAHGLKPLQLQNHVGLGTTTSLLLREDVEHGVLKRKHILAWFQQVLLKFCPWEPQLSGHQAGHRAKKPKLSLSPGRQPKHP